MGAAKPFRFSTLQGLLFSKLGFLRYSCTLAQNVLLNRSLTPITDSLHTLEMTYDSCVFHCATTNNSSVNAAILSHESVQLYYHRTISHNPFPLFLSLVRTWAWLGFVLVRVFQLP